MADIITLDSDAISITKHLKKYLNQLEHCWIIFDVGQKKSVAVGYAYRCTTLQMLDAARKLMQDKPKMDLQILEYFLSGQELILHEVVL